MDARHFDRLTRALSEHGTRRGLMGLLAMLPVLGGLLALLDHDETDAKGRRKRRKKKHKHGRPRRHGKRKKKKCKPNSLTKTCAGKCGQVKNNCQKTVDCGACGCPEPCADGETCCDDGCVDLQTNPDHCGACGQTCSGDTPVCWNGACVCGDVCANGCQFAFLYVAIGEASSGDTIRICAGSFGAIILEKNITLIGAGDGSDASSNTILDAAQQGRGVETGPGVTATLQGLRITGGQVTDTDGAGIRNRGQLTMTDCTVTGNHAVAGQIGQGIGGGIVNYPDANLTMTDCTISDNSAAEAGGGILLLQGTHTLTNCTFTGNTADDEGGAIYCSNGATTLVGCTIGPGNDAPEGAIVAWNSSTKVTLDATMVSGNTGTTVGGINNLGGVVTLQNGSMVSGNSPSNCLGTITGPGCAA